MVPLRKSTVRTVSVRISSTRPPQSTWLREGCAHLWCPVEPYRSCGTTVMPLPSLEIANDRQQSAPISSNRQNRIKNRRIFASWKKRDRRGASFQQRFKARGCHLTNSSITDPLLILYWSFTHPLLILYSAFAPTRKRHIMAPSLPGIAYIGNIGGRHHDACIGQGESSLTRLSNHSNMSHRLHGSHGFSCVTSYGFRATKIHFSYDNNG